MSEEEIYDYPRRDWDTFELVEEDELSELTEEDIEEEAESVWGDAVRDSFFEPFNLSFLIAVIVALLYLSSGRMMAVV